MSISGIGVSGASLYAPQQSAKSSQSSSGSDAIADFMNYMKETPEQRMQEAWLKSHGISKEEFDAMSPERKAGIVAQMRQEIEQKLREKSAAQESGKDNASSAVDMLV